MKNGPIGDGAFAEEGFRKKKIFGALEISVARLK